MCTLSILRGADGLTVTMNRDDVAARVEAPPTLWQSSEGTFTAPKDLQAGGTWIGVNAHGVIACLLNRYDPARPGRTSRGAIVPEAMSETSAEKACSALAGLDHHAFSPFTCVVIDRDSAARLDWTGAEFSKASLASDDDDVMLTSSSWQFDEVKVKREAYFRMVWAYHAESDARIAAFHSHRDRACDEWAPMMQRPKSQTKSVTQVEITSRGAEMRYWSREAAIERQLRAPEIVAGMSPA